MTTRTEAAGYAEAWATHADRAATDFRNVSYAVSLTDPKQAAHHGALRDQAEAMALMWARVAELLPENPGPNAAEMQELNLLRAARERTIWQMQNYRGAGFDDVNPRQVIGLLSLTWPDGNYEGAPEADHA